MQSREITKFAAQGYELKAKAVDAAGKVTLLREEVAFTESLSSTLQQAQELTKTVDAAQNTLLNGQLLDSIELLGRSKVQLEDLQTLGPTTLVELIRARISEIQSTVSTTLSDLWNDLIQVDPSRYRVTIKDTTARKAVRMGFVLLLTWAQARALQ